MAIPSSDLPGHSRLRERVVLALETCIELPSLEFKQSADWETLQFKIIRSALAMPNLRDGGVIVIGVSEKDDSWEITGIAAADLATYEPDIVADAIHKFASPAVSADLVSVEHKELKFLALNVREFDETPVVCRRDGPPGSGLKQGTVYVRPTGGKPQTTELRDAAQMHELLELAAEKRARRMLETGRRIGLSQQGESKFDEELGDL